MFTLEILKKIFKNTHSQVYALVHYTHYLFVQKESDSSLLSSLDESDHHDNTAEQTNLLWFGSSFLSFPMAVCFSHNRGL